MHRFRPKVTPPLVISLLALFIAAGGGDALAEIIISDNSQVAKGTISGHNPPAGKRSNVIKRSINGKDLSEKLLNKIESGPRCPDGTSLASTPPTLCYSDLHPEATIFDALDACAAQFLRLPTLAEAALIFENLGAPQDDLLTAEYDRQLASELGAIQTISNSENRRLGVTTSSPATRVTYPYRCVGDPVW
jgi:hypothetical protein